MSTGFSRSFGPNGLIQTKGTQVTIPDWERLKEAGEFDPLYLHLEKEGTA